MVNFQKAQSYELVFGLLIEPAPLPQHRNHDKNCRSIKVQTVFLAKNVVCNWAEKLKSLTKTLRLVFLNKH